MADSDETDVWVEGFSDKHQRPYWRNKQTKETSWKPPARVTKVDNKNRPLPPKPPKSNGSTKNPLARHSSKRTPSSSSPPPPPAPSSPAPPPPVPPAVPVSHTNDHSLHAENDIELTSLYSTKDEFPGVDDGADEVTGEYQYEEEEEEEEEAEEDQDYSDNDAGENDEQQQQQHTISGNSNSNNASRPQSWIRVTKSSKPPPSEYGAQAGQTFGDYWVGAAKHIDGHELIGNWKEVQATLGVVAALLLSIVFGRVGLEYEKHDDTLWGQTAGVAQTVSTCCNFVNTIICLYITITSARAYILLCMYPADQGKVAFAHIGSTFLVDIPYLLWPVLSSLFIVDALIMATLATPYYVGVGLVLFAAIVTPLCIGSWIKLDTNGTAGLKALSIITSD